MSKWSESWNALPEDVRLIGSMILAEMRINQLEMEKDRLEKRYRQSMAEVNSHIDNLKKWISREGL